MHTLRIIAVVFLISVLSGCGGSSTKPDGTPPAAVTDLTVLSETESSVTLTWTASGDDGSAGRAAVYDLRYVTSGPITAAGWDLATRAAGAPRPGSAGTPDSFTIAGLDSWEKYYFAVKAGDEVPNWSSISNPDSAVTAAVPTSINGVLANLKGSYEGLSFVEYTRLFAPNYEYVFSPFDVGNDGIPQSWGISDELASADNMFRGEPNKEGYQVESIHVTFTIGNPENDPSFPDWTKVTLSQVFLSVATRHKDTGDPLDYRILGDRADLYFVQTAEQDPVTDLPVWKIVQWVDRPIVGAAVATKNTTWGRVKGLWR